MKERNSGSSTNERSNMKKRSLKTLYFRRHRDIFSQRYRLRAQGAISHLHIKFSPEGFVRNFSFLIIFLYNLVKVPELTSIFEN